MPGNAPRYRLAWRIPNHGEGHGEWQSDPALVDEWVRWMNNEYGRGTHWRETEALTPRSTPTPDAGSR